MDRKIEILLAFTSNQTQWKLKLRKRLDRHLLQYYKDGQYWFKFHSIKTHKTQVVSHPVYANNLIPLFINETLSTNYYYLLKSVMDFYLAEIAWINTHCKCFLLLVVNKIINRVIQKQTLLIWICFTDGDANICILIKLRKL